MPTQTATTITMPQLGESVTEGTIGAWLKQVGDRVEKYDPLVEVETDKVNSEIPSPVAGVLVEILIEPESTVPVGAGLCRIDEAGEGSVPPAPQSWGENDDPQSSGPFSRARPSVSPQDWGAGGAEAGGAEPPTELDLLRTRSSPAVRRIAEEHGLDIGQIDGTGIGGRVTKQDILAYVAQMQSAAPASVETTERVVAAPPAPAAVQPPEPRAAARPAIQPFPGDEVVPVTPMRRQIAEHMVRSERLAPHVTTVVEVDMTNVVAYRAARKEDFARREGIELSYLPFAIKAVTLALRDHPRMNAVWDEERIIHRNAIHVGVAVGLEDGLIVPVVKHADRLSLTGLAHAVADLIARARAGNLTPDDVTGGTFTVNNPGTFGSIASTPILVQPQVAILSTEAIVKRPVVVDDMIAIRSMMNLSLSFDHRALDGLAAARFLQRVKRWLEGVDDKIAV
ncbi:MAG TPA: dihydrolipoamide acetyltransferase family protein [Thermomicrobiales bacterium]|jgi:2-oxoisovalerate dehydrogenase E2 component (dihydrolipoyl transacylase)